MVMETIPQFYIINNEYCVKKSKKYTNILKSINKYKKEVSKLIVNLKDTTKTNDEHKIDLYTIRYVLSDLFDIVLNLNFYEYSIENTKILFMKLIDILVLCNLNDVNYNKQNIYSKYQYFLYNNINYLTTDNNFKKLKKIKNFDILNDTEITKDINNFVFVFPKYDKSCYKDYIKNYLDYIIKKYNNYNPNRILNLICLVTNKNIDFKYFKTFFKIFIKRVKSINKPYAIFLYRLIYNKCDSNIIKYVYEKYKIYLNTYFSENSKMDHLHEIITNLKTKNYIILEKCIHECIKSNNIELFEKLYNLVYEYMYHNMKDNFYSILISKWEETSKSNKKMLFKIVELIEKDEGTCFSNVFANNDKTINIIYSYDILRNKFSDKFDEEDRRMYLIHNFSLENLVNYSHLFKGINIKTLLREELLHYINSNNKLKRMIKKFKKIFNTDKYLEKQFKYILNKKYFIEEYMENRVYNLYSIHYEGKGVNFLNTFNTLYKGLNMTHILIRNIKHCITEDSVYIYELVFCNPNSKMRSLIMNNIYNFYKDQSVDTRKEKLFEMVECLDPNDHNYNTYIYNKNGIPLYKINNQILNLFNFKKLDNEIDLVKEIINKYPYITTIDSYYTNFVNNNLQMKECIICFENELCYTFRCHDTHSICKNCFPKIIKKECPLCRINTGFVI